MQPQNNKREKEKKKEKNLFKLLNHLNVFKTVFWHTDPPEEKKTSKLKSLFESLNYYPFNPYD